MATDFKALLKVIMFQLILTPTDVACLGEMVIGDIQLVLHDTIQDYSQPLVYFTNGIEPPQLGGICYDNIGRTQATVICNQLGYELNDFMGTRDPITNPTPKMWFNNVKCDKNKQLQHILSCNYSITFGSKRAQCKTDRYLIVNCDQDKHLTVGKYDGHILLCPPDNFTTTTTSTSFGLVIIYLSKYDIWRGLNQPNSSEPLGLNEANAICQQLGYTTAVPGSAVTTRAVQPDYTFDHCYDGQPPFRVQREAWMPTDDIHCPGPQTCFGCCYNYPSTDNCASCDQLNDLVIQCTFVPDQVNLSSGKGGAENECIYSNTSCVSSSKTCTDEQHGAISAGACAGVIVTTNIIVAITTALISIASVLVIKKIKLIYRRRNLAAQEGRAQDGRGPEGDNEEGHLIDEDDHAPGGENQPLNVQPQSGN